MTSDQRRERAWQRQRDYYMQITGGDDLVVNAMTCMPVGRRQLGNLPRPKPVKHRGGPRQPDRTGGAESVRATRGGRVPRRDFV